MSIPRQAKSLFRLMEKPPVVGMILVVKIKKGVLQIFVAMCNSRLKCVYLWKRRFLCTKRMGVLWDIGFFFSS